MPNATRKFTKRRTYRSKATIAKRRYVSKRRYRYKKARYQKLTKQVARNRITSDRFFSVLKYQARPYTFSLNSTNQINGSVVIRGNSLYDPEYATGGGQPFGFDNIKTIYNYYKVHASKIKVQVFNRTSTSNGGTTYLTIYPSVHPVSPNTSVSQYALVSSQSHSRGKMLGAGINTYTKDRTLTHRMLSKVALGVSSIRDVSHQTNVTADPAENIINNPRSWYWIITLWNADVTTTSVTYQVDITIDYMVEFTRPNALIDYTLYGDPDGVNDVPDSYSGIQLTYEPTFGGSGSNAIWTLG